MAQFFIDFTIVAILVIGITALMGVILNGIGENIFGGQKKRLHTAMSEHIQTGWKTVGGKKASR
ncbi:MULTISPECIES: hypothetical protein [Anoxybacillus]|uniref:Uncharacterized protein n=1 Tax=Anoxybacillus ayderensis TaxID=265546 RepID=A0A0D0HVB9_9BACL|nr:MULTISPECIES: hypothetical protein [Anoxybacillus]EMI10159.1 hypothetical protein F510_1797 [Anoxybacillus gonensis]EPZ38687.1 hypothetical protein C289_1271 [Anoxybacillus ayderensis]KIP21708.1 hypothetical protein JV16_00908 [Anoxybacillus ayderensis]MCQ5364037.1 hypothetical protein [Anoxybacillus gonensis]MCX8047192.1 hypothetical protein [Anoxybacillus gonensis]